LLIYLIIWEFLKIYFISLMSDSKKNPVRTGFIHCKVNKKSML